MTGDEGALLKQPVAVYDKGHAPVVALAYSFDGQLLAAGDGKGKIIVYDTATQEASSTL